MGYLVSVIVPIYNVSKYLDRCIGSLVNQTYKNIEIILVDDGSKDESGKICDQYKEADSRIKVIHKENAGLGMARNTGIEATTGKYVYFLDGDDYLSADSIEHLYTDMISNCVDTVIGGYKRVFADKTDVILNPNAGRLYRDANVTNAVLLKMLGKKPDGSDGIEMSVWKTLFSLEIIKDNNIRFPSERVFISEDIIFDTDYFKYSNSVFMSSDVGYHYCDNLDSLTTKYRSDRFEKQCILYHELSDRCKKLGIYRDALERLNTTFLAIARYSIKLEVKFARVNGISTSIRRIRKILNNETLQQILKNYDNDTVPIKSKLINKMMYHKNIMEIILAMLFKNLFGV